MYVQPEIYLYTFYCIFLHVYLCLIAIYMQIYIYIGAFWLAFGPILHHLDMPFSY